MTAFKDFVDAAWADHGDDPSGVADRLARSLDAIVEPADVVPFARITAHVYGEHLGRWREGVALLDALRELPAWDGSAATRLGVDRYAAVLNHCAGVSGALDGLGTEDTITVLATAALALAERKRWSEAIAAYSHALALAEPGLPDGSPAIRALAAGGNNLANALADKAERDASETTAMVVAADAGVRYWASAGTWLEQERAEYMLSRCLRLVGRHGEAVLHGERCLAICARDDAPAFEEFFAHCVLALAQREAGLIAASASSRALALECYERVAADERHWCARELEALGT